MRLRSLCSTIFLAMFAAACGKSAETTAGTGGKGAGGGGTGGGGGGGAGGGGASLTVQTDKGPVQGELLGSTRTFLGIPYAAPPIGDLRWKPPAPAAAWTDTLQATK